MRWRKELSGLIVPERPPAIIRSRGDALTRDGLLRTRGGSLALTNLIGFAAGGTKKSFFQILTDLSLTTNLKCCIDLGDLDSYDGSSQTLTDRTETQDFWRGTGSGADSTDWTFVGTAGGLSSGEYALHDGGDYSTGKAAPAYQQELHKNGAILSVVAAVYLPNALTGANAIIGTGTGASETGFVFRFNGAARFLEVYVTNAGAAVMNYVGATAANTNAWNIIALTLNEATGASGGTHYANGTAEAFTSTYTSPSAGNATDTIRIGSNMQAGAAANIFENGVRLGVLGIWQGTRLTDSNLDSIRSDLRGRYSI